MSGVLRPIVGPVAHFGHVFCRACWMCVSRARFPHTATMAVVAVGVFFVVFEQFSSGVLARGFEQSVVEICVV